jgi:hypothetical protein
MVPRRRHFIIDIIISTDHVSEVISALKARRFGPVILASQGSVNLFGIESAEALVTDDKDRQQAQPHAHQVLHRAGIPRHILPSL